MTSAVCMRQSQRLNTTQDEKGLKIETVLHDHLSEEQKSACFDLEKTGTDLQLISSGLLPMFHP
jgi:hypothetical protein